MEIASKPRSSGWDVVECLAVTSCVIAYTINVICCCVTLVASSEHSELTGDIDVAGQ